MESKIETIEDCLEFLVGLQGEKSFQIEKSDYTFLNSVGRQTFRGVALTDKQHNAIKNKLLTYKNQLAELNCNVDLIVDNLRMPLREINRDKYIKICTDNDEIPLKGFENKFQWIKIRFPFSKKLIILVEEVITKIGRDYHHHNKGSHEHYFVLNEKSIFEIISKFENKEFNIDDKLQEQFKKLQIMNNNKNKYIPGIYNLKLKNLNDRTTKYMISTIGEPSIETLALYKDRQELFGLHYFDQTDLDQSMSYYSTLSKKIINRTKSHVFANSTKYTLNNISESLLELNRFPLLVVLSDSNPLDDLYSVHQSLKGFIDHDESTVMFRLDNADNAEFNTYIKKNSLNSKLDKNTKVVYINSSNITKPLLNSDWIPSAVLLLSSHRLTSKIKVFVDESDLVIHYDDNVSQFKRFDNTGIEEL